MQTLATREPRLTERIPPHVFFIASAVFHSLGPALAVLLFQSVAPLGVAWLRIATATLFFAIWRRPWRFLRRLDSSEFLVVMSLGVVLATMNSVFYEAIARLPLGTVSAIEFLGPIGLALAGSQSNRNFAALAFASSGVIILTDVRLSGEPLGFVFAFANCGFFILYVVLGHRLAAQGGSAGVDRLATSMLVAALVALPFGIREAEPVLLRPDLFAFAVVIGVTSSVIPYVCDQFAMARLPRATFALFLSLLPATATAMGVLLLRQFPRPAEVCGIALVVVGVALHRPVVEPDTAK